MDVKLLVKLIGLLSILCAVRGAPSKPNEGELGVILEFIEFELEDICVLRSDAEWNYLNGTYPDLEKLLEAEKKLSELYKKETESLQIYDKTKLSTERLKRLVDVFYHLGAPLLDSTEFNEYRDYSRLLQEISTKHLDTHEPPSIITKKEYEKQLRNEPKTEKLSLLWKWWFETLESSNKHIKYDFLQQLSILELEAEQNGEEDLGSYWLKQSDITWVNYDTVLQLWQDIIPLFTKIRNYLAILLVHKHGKEVLIDPKLIPVHILGSLQSENWIPAAEKSGAFQHSEAYKKFNSLLNEKTYEDLYKAADYFTSELKLGDLPARFYYNSRFNVSSPTCHGKTMDYCKREHDLRAISCGDEDKTITRFLEINEEVMRMKHLLLAGKEEEENGYLFREGPRDSVLYESVTSLSSLLAINPINLRKQEFLPNNTLQNEEMLSLLLSALHVIPSLPYYLATDLWRIHALKEIDLVNGEITPESSSLTPSSTESGYSYDVEKRDISGDEDEDEDEDENEEEAEEGKDKEEDKPQEDIVKDKEEEKEDEDEDQDQSEEHEKQKVTSDEPKSEAIDMTETSPVTSLKTEKTTKKVYDFEMLKSDWWRFRGKYQGVGTPDGKNYADFLQDKNVIWNKPYISKFLGKILQFQLLERFKTGNYTANLARLQNLLKKGKSASWETIVQEIFNITEISTAPLLAYYKPLEDFLDNGGKFQNKTPLFGSDKFNLFSNPSSLNSTPQETETATAEGNDAFLFILGCVAGLGVVAIIVTIARRKYRKKQRIRLRKAQRKAEELALNVK